MAFTEKLWYEIIYDVDTSFKQLNTTTQKFKFWGHV